MAVLAHMIDVVHVIDTEGDEAAQPEADQKHHQAQNPLESSRFTFSNCVSFLMTELASGKERMSCVSCVCVSY